MNTLPDIKIYSGQALLLVLLSMAVILTIVLSILSRTITDVGVTTSADESLRAFSAAEAGIERALIIGSDTGDINLGDSEFSASVSEFSKGTTAFSFPQGVLTGESTTAWFVAHDDLGELECSLTNPCFTGDTIKVCWGREGTASGSAVTPALELTLYYLSDPTDPATITVARATSDPNATRRTLNNFSANDAGTCVIGDTTFEFQVDVDLASLGVPLASYGTEGGLQFAKAKLFYNSDIDHPVGFDVNFPGNSTLPAQGVKIDSTGTSGVANRRIEVYQSFGEIPSVFASSIFSLGGVTK